MSAAFGSRAVRAARALAVAGCAVAALTAVTALAGPARADGVPSGGGTPIKGRTEGGSLELKSGDIVACAGVGDLRVAGADGQEHLTNGPGTTFTTPAGTTVRTVQTGTVEVTVQGASAVITCGPELFPTTNAVVPSGPSLAGEGGGTTGTDPLLTTAGSALAAAGIATATVALRRRRTP
ncbi:hypothetical protein [Kitasatospora camelliae]|uniref:LPXTG-motif cell wall-anchored protein n=1 Tax=Kitasatospora camelliae TaxID=3156397 RepID=A0AAU8JVN6_9ACTN